MATFTVTNVERHADGTPWAYGGVKLAVAGPQYDSNGNSLAGVSYEQTDGSGSVTVSGLTVGVVYTWTHADGTQESFTAGAAGTYALDALLTTAAPATPGAVTPQALAALSGVYAPVSSVPNGITASEDGSGNITVTPRTQWSYDPSGNLYFSADYSVPAGNTPAVASYDPTTGYFQTTKIAS